jgi:hypothetical protein
VFCLLRSTHCDRRNFRLPKRRLRSVPPLLAHLDRAYPWCQLRSPRLFIAYGAVGRCQASERHAGEIVSNQLACVFVPRSRCRVRKRGAQFGSTWQLLSLIQSWCQEGRMIWQAATPNMWHERSDMRDGTNQTPDIASLIRATLALGPGSNHRLPLVIGHCSASTVKQREGMRPRSRGVKRPSFA